MISARTIRCLFGGRQLLLLSFCFLALWGCTPMVGPDFKQPQAPVANSWTENGKKIFKPVSVDSVMWWEVFQDPVLDELIARAFSQNLSLRIAGLRVLEARAQLGIAGGNLYPQTQQGTAGFAHMDPGTDRAFNEAAFGFDVAWEIDLWGKLRRGVQAADANLLASVAGYDDVLVSITAEVARVYVLIRSLEERIRVARQNVRLQERILELTRVLYEEGSKSELDFQQASSQLYSTRALVPSLEISLRQAQISLSILLGMPPCNVGDIIRHPASIPRPPAEVAVGIPADLLRRRPDIRQAEVQALAQCANIGVAKADLYPSLTLLGSLGWSATDLGKGALGDVFNASSFGTEIGPSVRWNILNYGRIINNVRSQDARFEQLLVNYRNVVLNAAGEVENAMARFLGSTQQADLLDESVRASQRSLDISLLQYREGVTSYQRVLDSTGNLTRQQDQQIQARGTAVTSLVAMYKALGGGWQVREGKNFVPAELRQEMKKRTNWGNLLETRQEVPSPEPSKNLLRWPDW